MFQVKTLFVYKVVFFCGVSLFFLETVVINFLIGFRGIISIVKLIDYMSYMVFF